MEKEKIVNDILAGVSEKLRDLDVEKISVVNSIKNNGISLTGLSVKIKNKVIAPCIYLDNYINDLYRDPDHDLYSVVEDIDRALRRALNNIEDEEPDLTFDLNKAKKRVIIRLINYEMNKELLKDAIYIRFLDLAITFRWLVEISGNKGDILVTKKLGAPWGISIEELYEIAFKNTFRYSTTVIAKLDSFISSLCLNGSNQTSGNEGSNDLNPALLLTNCDGFYGAVTLLNDKVLEDAYNRIGEDYYIIPSSVNELIAVPGTFVEDEEEVKQLIKRVNEEVVPNGQILSNSLYYYCHNEKQVSLKM